MRYLNRVYSYPQAIEVIAQVQREVGRDVLDAESAQASIDAGAQFLVTPTLLLDNCAAFLDARAYTVAIGGSFVSKKIAQQKDWVTLTALARQYVEACKGVG